MQKVGSFYTQLVVHKNISNLRLSAAVPQNTGGNEHSCGYCTLGCGAAQKQGPAVSWLPDAARAGATFAEGFKVENVLFEMVGGQKKAVGVKGIWTSRNSHGGVEGPVTDKTVREVVVRAKKVIVSCGTLWSPIILLNSGLTVSQSLGGLKSFLSSNQPYLKSFPTSQRGTN